MAPLSERELDVLRPLGSDLDGPDIARELVVSLNTLRTHTKSIYTPSSGSTVVALRYVKPQNSSCLRAAATGLLTRAEVKQAALPALRPLAYRRHGSRGVW